MNNTTTTWPIRYLLFAPVVAFCIHLVSLPIPNEPSLGTVVAERIVLFCYLAYFGRIIIAAIKKETGRTYWWYIAVLLFAIPYTAANSVDLFNRFLK